VGTSRAFLAIVPPRAVLDAVGKVAWRAAHRPAELALPRLLSPRWTTREQWHLTLQFLGSHVDLDAAADALSSVRGAPARVPRAAGVPVASCCATCRPRATSAGTVPVATIPIFIAVVGVKTLVPTWAPFD